MKEVLKIFDEKSGEPTTGLKFLFIEDGREMSISGFHGRKLMLHVRASW